MSELWLYILCKTMNCIENQTGCQNSEAPCCWLLCNMLLHTVFGVSLDLASVSMNHAHAIKQIHTQVCFQNLHCIGICSAVLIWEPTENKPRSYTPHTLSTEHNESTRSKNHTNYVLNHWQASLQNPILIWWAWQQIIFILVGQIKQKKSVSFQQL